MVEGILSAALETAGSQSKLAAEIGVPSTTISNWVNGQLPRPMIAFARLLMYVNACHVPLLEAQSKNRALERALSRERELRITIQCLANKALGLNDEPKLINDPIQGIDNSMLDDLKRILHEAEYQGKPRKADAHRRI